MSLDDRTLNSRLRRRRTAELRTEARLCWICGFPIDKTLDRMRHPLGFTVDEVVPRSYGGSSTERANIRPAHRLCNSIRGVRPMSLEVRERCQIAVRRRLGLAGVPPRPSRVW